MAILTYSFLNRVITIVYVIVIHSVIALYSALGVFIIKFLAKFVNCFRQKPSEENGHNNIAVTNWNV